MQYFFMACDNKYICTFSRWLETHEQDLKLKKSWLKITSILAWYLGLTYCVILSAIQKIGENYYMWL